MRLPRYPEYSSCDIQRIGELPLHWTLPPLYLRYSVELGKMLDSSKISGNSLIPYLRNVDVQWFSVNFDDLPAMDIDESELDRYTVREGDLLVCEGGEVGRSAIVPAINGVVGFQKALHRLRAHSSEEECPGFLYYTLAAAAARGVFNTGGLSTIAHLTGDQLRKYRFAKPPLEEQTAIAAFLDRETAKIDALIAEQEKLIALLAEKRQATISHAVTKGLNPDTPMKDSGVTWLGKVPAHWLVCPLKYLVTFSSGATPSKDNLDYWEGNIPWASAKDLKVEKLLDTIDHITQLAVDIGAASLLPSGTVLVVVRGMILARTFPVTKIGVPMAINQDLKGLQATKVLDSDFLAWLLRGSSDESLQRLDEAGHGTKALRMDTWSSMQLPTPPIDEQTEIVRFIETEVARLDALTAEATRGIALLKERRSALISAAVTGKIDVRQIQQ